MISRRDLCRLCEGSNLELVVSLEPTPIAEKYVTKNQLSQKESTFPLDLHMCKTCGHVQLLDIIDPKFLYSNYTFSTGNSKGLVLHFKEYAEKIIKKYNPVRNSFVVDVGSNDGTLLHFFKKNGLKVLGIDPAKDIALKATKDGIETLPEFLTLKLSQQIKKEYGAAKIVTANNSFAHSDDLIGMLKSIRNMLDKDGVFVFEFSYLLDIINRVLLGTIFHEHHSYHSLKPMVGFLKRNDMQLIDVERVTIQGGSLICTAQRFGGPHKISSSVGEILELEEKSKLDKPNTIKNFGKVLKILKAKLRKCFSNFKDQGKSIVGFGAARSGTTLITQMDLSKFLDFIVDDNKEKHGKFTPGDHIPVLPTKAIYEKKPDYIFILAWIHSRKIMEDNKKFLEDGGKFIVCFPSVRIIDKKEIIEI